MIEAFHLLAEHGPAIQERHLEGYNQVTCANSLPSKGQWDLLIEIFITKLTFKALLILKNLPPIEELFKQQFDINANLFFQMPPKQYKFSKKDKKSRKSKIEATS